MKLSFRNLTPKVRQIHKLQIGNHTSNFGAKNQSDIKFVALISKSLIAFCS